MSIVREIRQGRTTREIELSELRVSFKRPDEVEEVDPVEAAKVAKMVAMGRMRGMDVTYITVRRSELGG